MSKNRNLANLISSSATPLEDLIASAPSALNTLDELAAALNDDANFATTVTNALATKAPIANPVFTGSVTLPSGTTAQRPASPTAGMIRFNTDLNYLEEYRDSQWLVLSNKFVASGGIVTTYSNAGINYKVHTFTTSGSFSVAAGTSSIDYLIVAGGGGGATDADVGGGGGAGGLLSGTTTVLAQTYNIVVGAGGTGGTSNYTPGVGAGGNGSQGGNSSAFGLTAIGGGYGGTRNTAGGSGGSGGGGGDNSTGAAVGGAGTSGQGYAGGSGLPFNQNGGNDQGGGGGAGGAGNGASPGAGVSNSISGTAVTYAAGGRGLGSTTAAANTGNGGRGSATSVDSTGGSGIVIIRYAI